MSAHARRFFEREGERLAATGENCGEFMEEGAEEGLLC